MSFIFGESIVATVVVAAIAASASSTITSKVFTCEGVEMTWNWVLKPMGRQMYKLVKGEDYSKPHNINQDILGMLVGNKNIIFEVLEPTIGGDGVVTRYIIFEKKSQSIFNESENESVDSEIIESTNYKMAEAVFL